MSADLKTAPSKSADEPLKIKINDKWVNVNTWQHAHPGGASMFERLRNADCTDMFVSLHSNEAKAMVDKMKAVDPPKGWTKVHPSNPNARTLSFRAFRAKMEADGYFERAWHMDAFFIGIMLALAVAGTYLCGTHPNTAIFCIGLSMQQAGWIGHDYVHGRGKVSYALGRLIGGLINGFSSEWWSSKHNKHHVHTNQVGIDDDIANDPILHLHIPNKLNDVWFRKYQHVYYHFAYSFLYASWRMQSFQYAWAYSHRLELLFISCNFAWMAYLGWYVALGSILLGGWFVGEVVTATHQSEELIDGISYQFPEDQFRTTRNVSVDSRLFNWFWGGMQWQLEHHLFPTMPKYYYPEVSKMLKKWADENGVSYRASGVAEILELNYKTMRSFAAATPEEYEAMKNTQFH